MTEGKSECRIVWDKAAKEWRSIFPSPFEAYSRTHSTIAMAYDYMRDDCGITSYIQVVPKPEVSP